MFYRYPYLLVRCLCELLYLLSVFVLRLVFFRMRFLIYVIETDILHIFYNFIRYDNFSSSEGEPLHYFLLTLPYVPRPLQDRPTTNMSTQVKHF